MEEAQRELDEIRKKSNDMTAAVQTMLQAAPRPVKQEVRERSKDYATSMTSLNLDEIRNQLERVTADLEVSVGINPQIVERYNRYLKELDEVKATVSSQEKKVNRLRQSINQILAQFDPSLDRLVKVVSDRFAAAFEKVGCTGEVVVVRDERGFEYWGMRVLTSFRNTEALQALSGTLQSGGERSLATVTYLMSLSEMARTPFSLVDEINQGMDQRAERNVHNQLVEVTCGEDAGQYFLITPKLLTGLKYHRKMKVLIVNNGTWLPEATDKKQKFGDLKACIRRYKQHIAAR